MMRAVRAVLLNGIDVTRRCFYVDRRRHLVRLYDVDADGRKFKDWKTGGAAWREHRGRIQLCFHRKAAA